MTTPLPLAEQVVLPPPPSHVHVVGIGGIGTSGLARILRAWGHRVTGSDSADSPLLRELGREGIGVTVGHTAVADAATADLVVVTAAVRADNPEIAAAVAAGTPVVKRAALLGLLADARRGVAVAGSHGKSTTSGMLVAALRALGADPSYAVGATVAATGTNAAPGDGPDMVVEADEYDWSFLQLHPDVAIVTNIDYDHPDLFPDQDAYDDAFRRFVGQIRPGGTLVIAGDDPACARLLARADLTRPDCVVTFGEHADADWRLSGEPGAWRVAGPGGVDVSLPLAIPGRHNARNATAALAALVALGHEPTAAAAAIADFAGVGRRFEAKGAGAGVTVVDDYAHHPSELRATLRAARDRHPGRRLWAVFQPHTYSRLRALLPEFADALREADRAMVLDVYAARETDTLGVSSADLRALLPPGALAATDPADAARVLAGELQPGDVVLTLGAGSVTETGPLLLARLREDLHPAIEPTPEPEPPARPPRRARAAAADAIPLPGRPTARILRDSPMSLHTTWRIGGPADFLVRAPHPDDLTAALAWARAEGLPITVIGGGSNLLVGDRGLRGLVILSRTPGERAEGLVSTEDLGDRVRFRVAAQAPLSWTGRWAAEHGWAGLDWGVGLPGTIGGATVNNAGAHGVEQIAHLEHVVVLDNATGETSTHPASWLEAAYRHTVLKASPHPRPLTVLEVSLQLPKADPAELVRLAEEHALFRKQTQPTGACAGSTFANPPGDYAGRLLEVAGLKGYRVGNAGFSEKHGNWIVNDGGATAADIRALLAEATRRVREQFGIELRSEVEQIGEV